MRRRDVVCCYSWLLCDDTMRVRSDHQGYLQAVDRYLKSLLTLVKDLQVSFIRKVRNLQVSFIRDVNAYYEVSNVREVQDLHMFIICKDDVTEELQV